MRKTKLIVLTMILAIVLSVAFVAVLGDYSATRAAGLLAEPTHQAILEAISGVQSGGNDVQSTVNTVDSKVDDIQTKLDHLPPTWDQILPVAERFELVMGGAAVLDKETGLVWEQSPDTGNRIYLGALIHCYNRDVGGRKGWRLPTVEELASLVDTTQSNPGLPSGHPFSNVQTIPYWSAFAWGVSFIDGAVNPFSNNSTLNAWCVRGGQGVDAQ